jgi:hypothetical protein
VLALAGVPYEQRRRKRCTGAFNLLEWRVKQNNQQEEGNVPCVLAVMGVSTRPIQRIPSTGLATRCSSQVTSDTKKCMYTPFPAGTMRCGVQERPRILANTNDDSADESSQGTIAHSMPLCLAIATSDYEYMLASSVKQADAIHLFPRRTALQQALFLALLLLSKIFFKQSLQRRSVHLEPQFAECPHDVVGREQASGLIRV